MKNLLTFQFKQVFFCFFRSLPLQSQLFLQKLSLLSKIHSVPLGANALQDLVKILPQLSHFIQIQKIGAHKHTLSFFFCFLLAAKLCSAIKSAQLSRLTTTQCWSVTLGNKRERERAVQSLDGRFRGHNHQRKCTKQRKLKRKKIQCQRKSCDFK